MRTSQIIAIILFLFYGLLNAQEPNSLQTWWGLSIELGALGPMGQMKKHMNNNGYGSNRESWFGNRTINYPQIESSSYSITLAYGSDIKAKSKYEVLLHFAHLGEIEGRVDNYSISHYVSTSFQSISLSPTLIYLASSKAELQLGPTLYYNNTRYQGSNTRTWSGGIMMGLNCLLAENRKSDIELVIRYYIAAKNQIGPFIKDNFEWLFLPETKIGFGHLCIGLSVSLTRDKR